MNKISLKSKKKFSSRTIAKKSPARFVRQMLTPAPHFSLGGRLSAPQVTLSKTAVDVVENQPIEVSCKASGEPEPSLSWERLDGAFTPTVHHRGGELRISSAQRSDSGQYRCVAANSVGEHDQILSIVVRDGGSTSSIYVNPDRYDAQEGEDVTLRCETGGRGLVSWIKQGQRELPPRAYPRGETLMLRNVYPEDAGRYLCSVSLPGGLIQNAHSDIRVAQGGGPS